jgi:hypothetical protein
MSVLCEQHFADNGTEKSDDTGELPFGMARGCWEEWAMQSPVNGFHCSRRTSPQPVEHLPADYPGLDYRAALPPALSAHGPHPLRTPIEFVPVLRLSLSRPAAIATS